MLSVTVIIPAYKPNFRFTATLESLAAQTSRDFCVIVSLDQSDNEELPPIPSMNGVSLSWIRQPTRLGWVGNVNCLLKAVTTPYFMVLSHDDCISPTYIEKALAVLAARQDVIVAHGEVRYFGVRDGEVGTSGNIEGDRVRRAIECLVRGSHLTLGWRGVTRSDAIRNGLRLRTRQSDGLFSNHLWEIELLLQGASVAVDGIHYAKYTDATGLSRTYHRFSADQRSRSLADNVAALVEMVGDYGLSAAEQEEIVSRYMEWILSLQGHWDVVSEDGNSNAAKYIDIRPALARFAAKIAVSVATDTVAPLPIDPPDQNGKRQ
jgi:hypothetical protein